MPDYTLTSNDFNTWPSMIAMQNILGPGMADITDASAAAFIRWIDTMTLNVISTVIPAGYSNAPNNPVYNVMQNTQVKSWMTDFFTSLTNFTTNYNNKKLPEVYLANMYRLFLDCSECRDCLPSSSFFYQAFSTGADNDKNRVYNGDCSSFTSGPWGRPGTPGSWSTAIGNTFTTWGTAGVPADLANVSNLFSTTSWTNTSQLKTALAALWTSQAAALTALQGQTELDDNNCVFLLYLLCSLGTGTADTRATVQKVVNYATNSYELPNDTFIDTLVYYVMMLWVDPLGTYNFNSTQITNNLNGLLGQLQSTDAGTSAIKTCITKNLKIIHAVPTYPMVDPYNPNIGFSTRQSDVISAINSVWPCKQ